MLNKTTIAFTAALMLGSASASFAQGYRYPASWGDRYPYGSYIYQFTYEDPEARIGDRYPFLEHRYPSLAQRAVARRYLGERAYAQGRRADLVRAGIVSSPAAESVDTIGWQYTYLNDYEDPESRIGDRYPLLEHRYSIYDQTTGQVINGRYASRYWTRRAVRNRV